MNCSFRTPGTRLLWDDLAGWITAAYRIGRRRYGADRNKALTAHGGCLPRSVIDAETNIDVIDDALKLLKYGPKGLARPERGYRADHPTTPIIIDLENRRRVLLEADLAIAEGQNAQSVFSKQP